MDQKSLIIIIAAAVVVAAVGGGAYFLLNDGDGGKSVGDGTVFMYEAQSEDGVVTEDIKIIGETETAWKCRTIMTMVPAVPADTGFTIEGFKEILSTPGTVIDQETKDMVYYDGREIECYFADVPESPVFSGCLAWIDNPDADKVTRVYGMLVENVATYFNDDLKTVAITIADFDSISKSSKYLLPVEDDYKFVETVDEFVSEKYGTMHLDKYKDSEDGFIFVDADSKIVYKAIDDGLTFVLKDITY